MLGIIFITYVVFDKFNVFEMPAAKIAHSAVAVNNKEAEKKESIHILKGRK